MSPRPTTPGDLAVGIIAGEVALAAAGSAPGAPEWIKVTPRGEALTRDGRRYRFDPEALVARFSADAVDVALDLDHAIALRAAKGERVDAIGYAEAMEARADGTYARIRWLDGGTAVLAARTHRYVSPTFYPDATGKATWLHSIALVSAPALSMPALAHAGPHPEPSMKQIAKALGLPETADEAACLSALQGRLPLGDVATALNLLPSVGAPALLSAIGEVRGGVRDIAKKLGLNEQSDAPACLLAIGTLQSGGNEMVAQLQSQLATTSAKLETVVKSVREKDVADLLDGALKDKKIVPAQREHFVTLCATDDGLSGVRAMLAATVPGLQASGLDGREADTGAGDGDPAALSARARKLFEDRRAAGQPVDWSTAVTLAAKAQA